MPGSFRYLDALIADRVGLDFPDREGTRILDVGAGAGKYRDLLHDYPYVDAVEAHEPYVIRYELDSRYRRVFVEDVLDMRADVFGQYDLVILGDVLEHLTVEDAQALLEMIARYRCAVLVAVPFNYEQDAVDGVGWEVHKQPDLTPELFNERYPEFECLARDEAYGVYVRDPWGRWTLGEVPERPSVSMVVPTGDWRVHVHCLTSLWKLQAHHLIHGLAPLALQPNNGASVEKCRNRGTAVNLREPRITHLCYVDSDEGWPPDAVGRLLEHRAQVVGVPIRLKVQELHWNVTDLPGTGNATWNGRLLEVGGIGTGFLLVARSALERMIEAYPELRVEDDQGGYHTLFQTGKLSEDFTFCERWRAIGGRVWADPTIEVCHVGLAEFTGKLIDHMELRPRSAAAGEDESATEKECKA